MAGRRVGRQSDHNWSKFISCLINIVLIWRQIEKVPGKGRETKTCGCLSHWLCYWKNDVWAAFLFAQKITHLPRYAQGQLSVILMAPDDETVFKGYWDTWRPRQHREWLSSQMKIIFIAHTHLVKDLTQHCAAKREMFPLSCGRQWLTLLRIITLSPLKANYSCHK